MEEHDFYFLDPDEGIVYHQVGDTVSWTQPGGNSASIPMRASSTLKSIEDGDWKLCNPDGVIMRWIEGTTIPQTIHGTLSTDKQNTHSHYFKHCPYEYVDVYRVIELFSVTDPCLQHALKKLLVAGGRGHKDIAQDVQDVIDSCERWKQMREEENE